MLDVKDTVLRRELASIALATRKMKNFFVECCQRLGSVKDTFCAVNSLQSSHWRRGKRRTFFVECCQRLGPAGVHVSVVVGFHKLCCLVICSLQSPWLGVIFYPAYADHTD